ncbi:hypothetical protein GCM10022251_35290 [Phytohabitans flavus]|uniref:Uncharacterized protein n=1 Tax=Phytohabitans flavus TaxID=1076124 RepID=A0A6F8XMS2_9ACTN|nr:hypothetical protein Pflav_015170 [Phytohabitans flavus]
MIRVLKDAQGRGEVRQRALHWQLRHRTVAQAWQHAFRVHRSDAGGIYCLAMSFAHTVAGLGSRRKGWPRLQD